MSDTTDPTLRISQRYYLRANTARKPRLAKNDANWQAYRCEQDWSHKAEFQSRADLLQGR